tara:strand:+ start:1820 stop:2560 length:741 start_codon:yes stop_codon:yes gene_type:complete
MKIIGISGRKQAGKNTVANYITGCIIKDLNMVLDFDISNKGELEIETQNSSGQRGWGIFDITRKDTDFVSYADKELWPHVKLYHFADPLKELCINLFDLTPNQVYGTDEDKNTSTPYTQNGWKHDMTAREFLQYFGTDVMRKIKDTVWVDYTLKLIQEEQSSVALIPDVRFPNEIDAIQKAGGIVLRLTRDAYSDNHRCESALDRDNFDWSKFDHVIDNDTDVAGLIKILEEQKHIWSDINASNIH